MFKHNYAIYLETTRRCNLDCAHCMTRCDSKGAEMSTDQIITRILRPAWERGSRAIIFSGGEFLLRDDAFELLGEANRMGYMVRLASNGLLLSDEMLTRLKALLGGNLVISLGINSFEDDNHDTRQVPGGFAMELINRLKRNNVKLQVIVTIGKFNKHTFKDTIETLVRMKIPYNRSPFVPRNSNRYDLMLNAEELREFFYPHLSSAVNGFVSYIPFFLPEDVYETVSGQDEPANRVPTNPTIGCWCGSWLAINAEGETAPCPILLDAVSGGNVLKTGIDEILEESELFTRIIKRDQFAGPCGKCRYHYTCGGCRAIAHYLTGDVFGSDPTCFMNDMTPEELAIEEQKISGIFKHYARVAKYGKMYTPPHKKEEAAVACKSCVTSEAVACKSCVTSEAVACKSSVTSEAFFWESSVASEVVDARKSKVASETVVTAG